MKNTTTMENINTHIQQQVAQTKSIYTIRPRGRNKPVERIGPDGNVWASYKTPMDAAREIEYLNNIPAKRARLLIYQAIRYRREYGGWRWRYAATQQKV